MIDHAPPATGAKATWNAGLHSAVATASVVAGLGFLLGYTSLAGLAGPEGDSHQALSMWQILQFNAPALLLLFSGVATAGFSTLAALVMIGGYVGATLAAATANVGVAAALGSIALYAPLEFVALLLAGVAGLLPLSATRRRARGSSRLAAYRSALVPSAAILASALVLLVIGAAVEAAVLVERT